MVFAWSGLGVQLYGGLIYSGNPDLDDSDLFDQNYDVLNFNDLASGIMPLMSMLVTGGVPTACITGMGRVHPIGRVGSTVFFCG